MIAQASVSPSDPYLSSHNFRLFSRFSRFTDDTVLTVAIADAVLHHKNHPIQLIEDRLNADLYAHKLKEYGRRFPNAGYGEMYKDWVNGDALRGYRSFGNGSAMRVSPVGFALTA